LKIDPFLLPSFWGINDIRVKQGKYKDAKKILLQALRIHENHDLTMILLSRIHRFLEEYGHSIELIKKALMINPSRIEAHLDLGLTYVLMKKYKDARAEADFIAEIANIPKEKNLSYLYLIGWISLEQRNWQAALENFEKALKVRRAISKEKKKWFDVTIENISNAIAETYLRQEKLNEAIKEYRTMTDLPTGWLSFDKPTWAMRHYKMATAYEKMNDPASAKREYEIFLQLWKDADPDIPEIVDAKKRLAVLRTQ